MSQPAKSNQTWTETFALACMVGLAYFLAASFSLYLTKGVGGIATIWPASGVFVAALLLARPGQTATLVLSVGLASLAANLAFEIAPQVALAFTLANLIEGVLISQLILRFSEVSRLFDGVRGLATFFGATVFGALVSGTIATIIAGFMAPAFFVSWFTTVSLGTLTMTPLILMILKDSRLNSRTSEQKSIIVPALLTLGIASISFLTLSLDDERFLFLPVIGVIAAAYLYGSRGAAISICLISVIAATQVDFSGSAEGSLGFNDGTLFLQFYLLSLLCAAWPLAALTTEKAKLIDRYAEANAFLKMAETTAKVGHWRLGSDNTSLVWSEEVYRIHGMKPSELRKNLTLDLEESTSLKLYHPEDRERVRAILLTSMDRKEGFAYQARIVLPDGTIRQVSSIGHPQYDSSGEFAGLFGTFQDITEQTKTLEALHSARMDALREAETARQLAETDDLTKIANRRKVLAKLRLAARLAKQTKAPLTVAIFDIDHFKTVNDRHGHQTGDQVLARVAKIASEQLKSTELVGRLGGEEFLVILPGKDAKNAYATIERLRHRIAGESWTKPGLDKITVSAGLASLGDDGDIEAAMQRADVALYRAKQDGRNLLRSAA